MPFDYKKLWILLIQKNMKKQDLQELAHLSSSTITKLSKGENVTTDVLDRICHVLSCDISDIMEVKKECN